ncbi:MAG: peroxiredoxin family protein [Cyclobacteriaceae bacterium]
MHRQIQIIKYTAFIAIFWLALSACQQSGRETVSSDSSTYHASFNPLPLSLLNLDSTTFQLSGKNLRQPIVAVLFNPECDHCQRQADELANNLDALKDVTVVMISSARLAEMKNFAQQHGMADQPNIFFAYGNPVDVYTAFGSVPVPYTVLYSASHRKIRDFQGEFEVGELVGSLR